MTPTACGAGRGGSVVAGAAAAARRSTRATTRTAVTARTPRSGSLTGRGGILPQTFAKVSDLYASLPRVRLPVVQ